MMLDPALCVCPAGTVQAAAFDLRPSLFQRWSRHALPLCIDMGNLQPPLAPGQRSLQVCSHRINLAWSTEAGTLSDLRYLPLC